MSLMWKFMCTFHHCSALFGCNASCSVTFRLCGIWCLCFIYIYTLLLTPSSTVEGDTWMRLKIYHIRVVVNLIYIFEKKHLEISVFFEVLVNCSCMFVCVFVARQCGWKKQHPEHYGGKRQWHGIAKHFQSFTTQYLCHILKFTVLWKKKKNPLFSLCFAMEYLPYIF